tara:strand:- start:167 stop:535 length:369 start_codon:yes stop_codon:yes gene_type:complete
VKLFSKSLLISLTAGFFQAGLPAKATPYIYTTGGFLDSNTRLCVREAKRIANASGFEVIEIVYDNNSENGATIFGRNFSRKTSFTFRCETAYGTYSYATGSLDNSTAYEFYQNVIKYDPLRI